MSMTLLTLGGIAAAVTAGWQQIRSAFNYVSGMLIVKADFDPSLTEMLQLYLKTSEHGYRALPRGHRLFVLRGRYVRDKGKFTYTYVPFEHSPSNMIYVRKGWPLLVEYRNNRATFTFVRGTFDPQDFTKRALTFNASWESHTSELIDAGRRRFNVVNVQGADKTSMAIVGSTKRDSGESDPLSPESAASTAFEHVKITQMDKSFMYSEWSNWNLNQPDPMDGLYLDEDVMARFEQAKKWMTMREWYSDRGIPWRRGWLLQGPGGTGKSSLARALARTLDFPIYRFFLSTLSDQEFMREWERMSRPCVPLFEDIDTVFNGRENITAHKSLTFDCVINAISGVDAPDGIFLVVTTNRLEFIDPAFGVASSVEGVSTRPGRIDTVLYLGNMSVPNCRKLANRILADWPEDIEAVMAEHAGKVTPVQFQEICLQKATTRLIDLDTVHAQVKPQLKIA